MDCGVYMGPRDGRNANHHIQLGVTTSNHGRMGNGYSRTFRPIDDDEDDTKGGEDQTGTEIISHTHFSAPCEL